MSESNCTDEQTTCVAPTTTCADSCTTEGAAADECKTCDCSAEMTPGAAVETALLVLPQQSFLGPDAEDITPEKNGGVLKEVKRPGVGDAQPVSGDAVYVHYVGKLTDGKQFDSSRDRGELFEFALGKGKVIKAWDIGVATMRRGELAMLQCHGDYAYGDKGSPPDIPPNATLLFEVELLDWKGEDITDDKDGGILKSILSAGPEFDRPNESATCSIHIIGRYEGRVFEDRDVTFIMFEGSEEGVVEGVETAVKGFNKGERARLAVKSRLAYGEKGNEQYGIPPNSDLEYEVHLTDFIKAADFWDLSPEEKLESATSFKEKGTEYFQAGKYKLAKIRYQKVVDFLRYEESLVGENHETRKRLLAAGHNNIAMCNLRLNDFDAAVEACDMAIELDKSNEKALFRRATANQHLHRYEEAAADYKTVLQLDPTNKAARTQLAQVCISIRDLLEKERRLYAAMCQDFVGTEPKKSDIQLNGVATEACTEKTDSSKEPQIDGIADTVGHGDEVQVTAGSETKINMEAAGMKSEGVDCGAACGECVPEASVA